MEKWIDSPKPDLPILKTAFDGLCVKSVHPCLARTFEDACFKEEAFIVVKERRIIRPIGHGEEAEYANDYANETLDDEDPSPSLIASRTGHSRDCIGEQTTKSGGQSG